MSAKPDIIKVKVIRTDVCILCIILRIDKFRISDKRMKVSNLFSHTAGCRNNNSYVIFYMVIKLLHCVYLCKQVYFQCFIDSKHNSIIYCR